MGRGKEMRPARARPTASASHSATPAPRVEPEADLRNYLQFIVLRLSQSILEVSTNVAIRPMGSRTTGRSATSECSDTALTSVTLSGIFSYGLLFGLGPTDTPLAALDRTELPSRSLLCLRPRCGSRGR